MGKKLDALLGRSFRPAKFKPLVNLAIARLAVLKNQRQVRCSQARSDVIQLLNLSHHERALLRVEQVIKEQNMLDAFVMMEGYCLLLFERVNLIEQEKECPDELVEAISTLLYAASRCGEFPELQEIRAVLTSRYGREFAARAIELRNNCGVNPRILQKLSTKMPTLGSRMNALKEIASENGITLQLEENSDMIKEESHNEQKQNQPEPDATAVKQGDGMKILPELMEKDEGYSGSGRTKKYRDVADAAQAAFESAAYAAAAARAAVELSRSDPHDPDNQSSPNPRPRKLSNSEQLMRYKSETSGEKELHMGKNSDTESDLEIHNINQVEESKQDKGAAELSRSASSSSDSAGDVMKGTSDVLGQPKYFEKDIVFDDSSDDDNVNKQPSITFLKTDKVGSDTNSTSPTAEDYQTGRHKSASIDPFAESGEKFHYLPRNQGYSRLRARLNGESRQRNSADDSAEGSRIQNAQGLNIEKKPISVRTRR